MSLECLEVRSQQMPGKMTEGNLWYLGEQLTEIGTTWGIGKNGKDGGWGNQTVSPGPFL